MMQIGVVGSSRTLTGSRLATRTILAKSVCHNYTGDGPNSQTFFLAPPGSTESEIEQFWHMKIVDVIISRFRFSGRKSRSVNMFFQQPDLGPRRDFTPRVSRPDKTNPPPGADFCISPSGFNYDKQGMLFVFVDWTKAAGQAKMDMTSS